MVCKFCNHTHAGGCGQCKKCHGTKAAGPSVKAQDRAKNNPNKGSPSGTKSPGAKGASKDKQVQKRTDWTVIGPNVQPVNHPNGFTLRSCRDVQATVAGKFLHINFKTAFPQLLNQELKIYSFAVRCSTSIGNGWVGLVRGFNPSSPTGPAVLTRKGFLKDQARGWQWLAPSDLEYDKFSEEYELVFEFKSDYPIGVVMTRDLYVVTSSLPRVRIPDDLLFVDEDLLEI